MPHRTFAVLTACLLVFPLACSGSGDVPDVAEEISFPKTDVRQPPPPEDVVPDLPPDEPDGPDVLEPEEIVPVQTGCGDGQCAGAETSDNCAKDCMVDPEKAAFVFAHKGDELGALGRIQDLLGAGAAVYVFYLTFDETPIEKYYNGDPATLSVASLGVPADWIYPYENYIEWGVVTGNHEAVDRLTQHFVTLQPSSIYVPQLCGGELEDELAHVVGVWAAKRAKVFPKYYEVPSRSNYYRMTDPDVALATSAPDEFVQHFIERWRLLPKSTEELKPTLGAQDMAKIRLAASHIQDPWLQGFLYKLPEDRVLFLLRELQRFRQLPDKQVNDKKPFLESPANPQGTFIYTEQGYTFDEFKQRAKVVESFYGTNLQTEPSTLPGFDEPLSLVILQPFDVELLIRSFSSEPDTLTFSIGFGPAKSETPDCEKPTELPIEALQKTQITVKCKAKEPIGKHVYYLRAYSAKAKANNDAAMFTEVPFQIQIGQ